MGGGGGKKQEEVKRLSSIRSFIPRTQYGPEKNVLKKKKKIFSLPVLD